MNSHEHHIVTLVGLVGAIGAWIYMAWREYRHRKVGDPDRSTQRGIIWGKNEDRNSD